MFRSRKKNGSEYIIIINKKQRGNEFEFDYIKTDKLLVVKIIEEIDHHTTEKK